ncbi:MAG: hypothetical protein MIO92_12005 [Methanosarcinaceae archaeon]|nr:hypothetical protein [Methanosarcinaceae archaeon]
MGFLDTKYDLRGTPFKNADLDYARDYWKFLIEHADPQWLIEPKGRLAIHWRSDTVPSAVQLIDLARLLFALAKSITGDSNPAFGSKLKTLLNSDGVQYREQLTEFVVGRLLTRLDQPLQLDCPSMSSQVEGERSKNVDYGMHWGAEPNGILVEVTVFHVQRIVDWEVAIFDIKKQFEQAVVKRNLNRTLSITAPLVLTRRTLSPKALSKALRAIENSDRGKQEIPLGKEKLSLEWSPAAHYEEWPGDGVSDKSGFAFTFGKGVEIGALAATSVHLAWPGDAEDLVNRSLRNTLDQKLKQFDVEVPYLLVVRILSDRVPFNGVIDLLTRRVFANKKYARISAVGLLKLTCAQNTGYQTQVHLVLNPHAINQLPEKFVAALVDN